MAVMNNPAAPGAGSSSMGPASSDRHPGQAPAVTVVIPVYQTQPYLSECLASVCGQTFADLQIVVVDDASTDQSRAVAESFAAADKRMEVVRQDTNRGPSAARNAGARRAIGKYIFYLDSDDFIATDAIAKLHALAERSSADVTFCRGQQFLENGRFGRTFPVKLLRALSGVNPDEFTNNWVFMSAPLALYNRQFLKQHNVWFDEDLTLGEDRVFLSRSLPRARSISALNEELYYYRKRQASLSNYDGLDAPRIREFITYNERVSQNYAALPMVRQHYLLTFVIPQIRSLVAVSHGGDDDGLRRMIDGMARIYRGLDLDLVRHPHRQEWRPVSLVPKRYLGVAEALSAGDAEQLRQALSKLVDCTDTPGVVQARELLTGDPAAALKVARAEIARDPSSAEAHLIAGEALMRIDGVGRSLTALVRAAKLDPDNPEIHMALCAAYLRIAQIDNAEASIDRARRISPSDSGCYRLKSRVDLASGDVDGAIAALQKAIALRPTVPDTHVAMARALLTMKRLPAAADILNDMWGEVPGLQRKRLEFWRLIAWLAARGEGIAAVHVLLAAHEPGTGGRETAYLVASLLLNEGRKHTATGSAAFPAARLHDLLATHHAAVAATKDWPLALAVAELEVLTVPQESNAVRHGQALLRLAEDHGHAGSIGAAVRALKFAQQTSPQCPGLAPVARRIGALAERRGDLAAAIECASVSSQTRPTCHDFQEHVVELRSRFARQLALGHSSIGSVA
jgi:glycosyltransferase involved in cell wall biosynthesis/Flp pilus assembly protein TadD